MPANPMATRRNWLVLRLIQLRRHIARRRLMRDMGWRDYWTHTRLRRFT